MPEVKTIQDQFITWLSGKVSPARLSELYIVFNDIESFCIQRKIINKKLFETTELSEIKAVIETIYSNKVFRFTYKKKLSKMCSAIKYYYDFLKVHHELQKEVNPLIVEEQNIESTVQIVSAHEEIKFESDVVETENTIDFSKKERLTYTKPIFFSYFGEIQANVNSWTQLYVQVMECMLDDYPDILKSLLNQNISGQGRYDFADEYSMRTMTAPKKVADNFYLETNLNATDIISKIRHILDICNVDYENLIIKYIKKEYTPISPKSTSLRHEKNEGYEEKGKKRLLFIEWMQKSGVSVATILSYVSAITKCTKNAQNYGISNSDLFNVTDINELKQIELELFSVPEFKEYNKQQHNRFSAAFKKLFMFLSGEENARIKMTVSSATQTLDLENKSVGCELSEETSSRYSLILVKYFGRDGYQLGRPIFRGRFKRFYASEYSTDVTESDEKIDEILARIGTERDGRIFPKQDAEQNNLINDIINDIVAAFNSGASAVYIEAVYDKYQQRLADNLQIYHMDALTPLLLGNAKGKFTQKYSYLVSGWNNADPANDILRVMKEFNQPQGYDVIHEKIWYIPYNKMKHLLVMDKSIVNVAPETYFYAPKLPVSTDELQQLSSLIQNELEYRSYITDVEMVEIIKNKCPSIAVNTEGFTTYGLRNCLGYIFRDIFSFHGPIISAIGSELSMSDVYAEFARTHEVLSFDELKNLSGEMNISIYWDSVLNEMVRVSEKELVRRDLIHFDATVIDNVLDEMCPGSYIPLKDISLFLYFPNIGYQWNQYILESYLYSGSKKFKLLHVSFGQNSVCGAMVRVDSNIVDYRALIVDVLSKSNALSSTKTALQYIVEHGYQQRRRYDGIEQIIQEAKLKKEQREKEDK